MGIKNIELLNSFDDEEPKETEENEEESGGK